jgi:hypothetical protein
LVIGLAAFSLFFLSGCVMTPFPVSGAWTQDVRVTLDGKIATGSKEGKACATSYGGFYAFGDASVKAAAADGGITRVQSVEAVVNSRIWMATYCTVVRGS